MSSIFAPTPAETTLVHQIFLQADPQKLGVVTGDAAVKIFDRAKLPPSLLADIWAMADQENNGWLSKKGVAKAVRLIGWSQHGRRLADDLLATPGPLAKLEGISPIAPQTTGMSLSKPSLPLFPVLTPQDNDKYLNIFRRAGPVNGLLSGEKARDIFLKSRLPNEQLVQIWNLADTQDRGALDSADFAIGMFFINGLMSKTITFIPTSLPPGLYQQAGGGVASHFSGNSGSFSPVQKSFGIQPRPSGQLSKAIQPNNTGMSGSSTQSRPAPALPARPSALNSPFHQAASTWDVTPADKANFDTWFDGLDTHKVGYIEGDVAVPFMLQSGLPGDILATVWDLSDLNSDGRLTRDGFAVAMYLIQKKLAGVEVPTKLPVSLIPPSMRPQAPKSEPVRDLFSFDDSPPPSAVSPQQTGSFATLQAQQTGTFSTLNAHPTGTRSPHNDPFSSTIVPTHTGSTRNFLDDDEPTTTPASPPLQDKSAEIGNIKNQFSSTTRSLDAARAERATLEQNLANQAAQLSSLQTQLSSAKAAYETEVKLLSSLKDRHGTQLAETQKTREELIRAESNLSALKVEKSEIEGAFMRDKEDARELHRRMVETGQQADSVKSEVEKIKKDAKQQKGLLAIAKKQLSSKEAEKAKAEKELEEAAAEIAAINKEQVEVNTALANPEAALAPALGTPLPLPELASSADTLTFAAAQPLPVTPDLGSPTISVKSNNPFDRLKTGGSTPRSQSPFVAFTSPVLPQDAMDDNFFTTRLDEEKSQSVEGLPSDSAETKHTTLFDDANGKARVEPLSPVTGNESDLFHTPPTSARNLSPPLEATQFPPIDDFTSYIAPLPSAAEMPEKPANDNTEFDSAFNLNDQVRELDIEESDSDSEDGDEDEDELPLSQVKQNVVATKEKANAPATERGTSFDDVFGTSSPPKEKQKEDSQTATTFDDIFGAHVPASQTNGTITSAESTAKGFPPVPGPVPFSSLSSAPAAPVAGVDVFDEALGKLSPNNNPTPPQQFSFDSAFDDNFDFAAAKEDFTPAPAEATTEQQVPAPGTFDKIYASTVVNGHAPAEAETFTQAEIEAKPTEATPQLPALSFDDVFSASPVAASEGTAAPKFEAPAPAPAVLPTASPKAVSPRSSNARPSSPLPDRLPPVRATSPKPRLSSSSSKDGEKIKDSNVRKLSLRLPFGRKKKQQHELMPSPSAITHLSPHPEQTERSLTPAVEDDVEPVKQLTSMGFSRTQAVLALETHGYDVQLALNSLLAS